MVFDLISSSTSTSLTNSSSNDRVFSTLDHQYHHHHHHHHHPMFHSSESKANSLSTIEPPLSDERDLRQIENAQKQQQQHQQQPGKWKMLSKRRQSCTSDLYALAASRYHRFKPSLPVQSTPITTTLATPPPSTSDEIHPSSSSDEFKFYPASINTRRSTTDCNDLLTLQHSRRLGNMETNNSNLLTIVDEESRDSMWPSTDDHHLLVPTSDAETPLLARFYSDPSITPISPTSSSSASSFNLHSNSTDLSLSSQYSSSISFFNDLPDTNKILSSSSSGYESNIPTSNSSLNSISDHLFLPSPDSIMMPPPATPPSLSTSKTKPTSKLNIIDSTNPNPDRNLVEQFIDLHLQKQNSFDQDVTYSPPSSFSSSSSSFHSQAALSTMTSPVCCRKCANHDDQQQLSSDTEDDSQSTTISTNLLPLQQQNKRPRSLPIAIQQPKGVNIDDTTEDEDDDDLEKTSSRDNSLTCHCPNVSSRKKRFRTCDLSNAATTAPLFSAVTSANGLFSDNTLISKAADKLHIDYKDLDDSNSSEHSPIKSTKNSLEHFIMSPTDKVKVQMKYPLTNNDRESDTRGNELKISQPEDIDFKRSKQKAIRVLYQNRLHLNSIQSPVTRQHNSTILPIRTATPGHGDSPLAKRTANPRLLRSVLSCSVFEADDEHEVVSSTPIGNPTGMNGTGAKSHLETFNFLRGNFTESLLHGKILPCGILDGFTVKLGASGLFMPKQVVLPVTTFWFNVSEHQAASPYLGFVNLQCLPKRGYHTPTKGTITIALLNPNGTAVHLFLILYDLSDMPPDHRTFIRQRIVLMPETTTGELHNDSRTSSKGNLRYLAHIRFVTSQTGKLYMHSDIRLIFARNKLDSDDRTATGKSQLVTLTDVPTPKYWSRK